MIEITDNNFITTLESYNNVIVDCWAEWCKPCKVFEPIFEETANENTHVMFAKLNTEETPNITFKMSIQAIPTILFFKNRVLVDRIIGSTSKEDLNNRIQTHFAKQK